jgi:hypothetical protein
MKTAHWLEDPDQTWSLKLYAMRHSRWYFSVTDTSVADTLAASYFLGSAS